MRREGHRGEGRHEESAQGAWLCWPPLSTCWGLQLALGQMCSPSMKGSSGKKTFCLRKANFHLRAVYSRKE